MYTQENLARDSTYEGWVAWIDGRPVVDPSTNRLIGYNGATPLFEAVPSIPSLPSIVPGATATAPRSADRQTIDWKILPHARVIALELYAFRDVYRHGGTHGCGQPLVHITAQPNRRIRWIQYKRTGMVIQSAVNDRGREVSLTGKRLGVVSWVMGYWDMTVGQAQLWEFPAHGGKRPPDLEFSGRNHPCWPRPLGFGLNPAVLGLTPEQVPAPSSFLTV